MLLRVDNERIGTNVAYLKSKEKYVNKYIQCFRKIIKSFFQDIFVRGKDLQKWKAYSNDSEESLR